MLDRRWGTRLVAEGFEERRDWNEREQPRKNWSRTSTENRPCLDCSLFLSSFSFPKKFFGFEVVLTYNTTKMRKYFFLTFQSVYFRSTGSLLNSFWVWLLWFFKIINFSHYVIFNQTILLTKTNKIIIIFLREFLMIVYWICTYYLFFEINSNACIFKHSIFLLKMKMSDSFSSALFCLFWLRNKSVIENNIGKTIKSQTKLKFLKSSKYFLMLLKSS
jgi:hypothetical protein